MRLQVLAGFGQSLENVDGILEYAQRLINEGYDHSAEAKTESSAAASSSAPNSSNLAVAAAASAPNVASSSKPPAEEDMGFSLFD